MSKRRSSSAGGRLSQLPLKVRNNVPSSSGRTSTGGRSSVGGRSQSACGRTPLKTRKSVAAFGKPVNRVSTVGGLGLGQRRSSVRGYGHEALRDLRPIKDSSYKEKNIRQLVEFLMKQHFPHQLSMKQMHSPQTKDFMKIFEFMVQCLQPGYSLGKKPEEEVPNVLKDLGYPFTISKTSMYAVGSPHTWPGLLAALSWLRELIEVTGEIEAENLFFPAELDDLDGPSDSKISFKYRERAYQEYLNGADTFEDLMEECAKAFRDDNGSSILEELQSENRTLKNQLQAINPPHEQILAMRESNSKLELDKATLQNYLREKQERHKTLEEQRQNMASSEIPNLETELDSMVKDNKRKQQIKDTQKFSQADLQKMNQSRLILQATIDSTEKEKQRLEEDIWSGDIAFSKIREQVEKKSDEYRQVASKMNMVPASASNALGFDLELPALPGFGKEDTYLDSLSSLTRRLAELKVCYKEASKATEDKIISVEDILEQLTELCSQEEQEVRKLEAKEKRINDTINNRKQMHARESEQLQRELDQLQDENVQCQTFSKQDSLRRLEETRVWLQKQKVSQEAGLQDKITMVQSALDLIIQHKTKIENSTQALAQQIVDLYESEKKKLIEEGYTLPESS